MLVHGRDSAPPFPAFLVPFWVAQNDVYVKVVVFLLTLLVYDASEFPFTPVGSYSNSRFKALTLDREVADSSLGSRTNLIQR